MSQHTSKADILRAILRARAPDAQLAVVVVAPALDAAPSHDRTSVVLAQGDRYSRVA